jgi:hypothetical protein
MKQAGSQNQARKNLVGSVDFFQLLELGMEEIARPLRRPFRHVAVEELDKALEVAKKAARNLAQESAWAFRPGILSGGPERFRRICPY